MTTISTMRTTPGSSTPSSTSAISIFSAPDISCGGCANAIRRSLGAVKGVEDIIVDIENKTITVTGSAADESDTILRILSTLDRAGFPATPVEVETAPDSKKDSATSSCSCGNG